MADWGLYVAFLAALAALTPRLGAYLVRVYRGDPSWLDPVALPIERAVYRIAGLDTAEPMRWPDYARALIGFSAVSVLWLYMLQRAQGWLPLNPEGLGAVAPSLAFNSAVSFVTNTNWQAYAGERTMSYFTQMVGLAYQNFMSAAAGMAVAVAVMRGLTAERADSLGNFWVDVTRGAVRVLLPASLVFAVVLISQGVVQNVEPYTRVRPLDSTTGVTEQVIPQGPVASQEAIKIIGTNGGGFFNANSAHPLENPTPLSNLLQILGMLAIAAAFPWMFGEMAGSRRHGWAVWRAMALLFVLALAVAWWAEHAGTPATGQASGVGGAAASLEGKEVRFGHGGSVLYAVATTAASSGAVNVMHDSLTPLGGMVPLVNILLGEVVFGGVGAGFYGMVVFVVLAVFIAGLMVGRTPEYLGKPVGAFEVQMAMVATLAPSLMVLGFGAVAAVLPAARASLLNAGPHGLTEMLYAYASAAGNNGSAFAGLSADTAWFNLTLGVSMLVGRYVVIVALLALAGHMAAKPRVAPSTGTFPVTTPLFTGLLVAVIVIVGALTFFPVLSLGPIVEHFAMARGLVY